MSKFAHIQRCLDLTDGDIEAAVESREETKALLDQVARVSAPNAGAAKLLLVFARLATTACEWMDGDLRIELVPAGDVTVFEVMTDLGGGMRERLFAPVAMNVPIDEYRRSVERLPQLIEPLLARNQEGGRLILTATAEVRRSSMPPASIHISEESMYGVALPVAPRAPTLPSSLEAQALPPIVPTLKPGKEPPAAASPATPSASKVWRGSPAAGGPPPIPLQPAVETSAAPEPSPFRGMDRPVPERPEPSPFRGMDAPIPELDTRLREEPRRAFGAPHFPAAVVPPPLPPAPAPAPETAIRGRPVAPPPLPLGYDAPTPVVANRPTPVMPRSANEGAPSAKPLAAAVAAPPPAPVPLPVPVPPSPPLTATPPIAPVPLPAVGQPPARPRMATIMGVAGPGGPFGVNFPPIPLPAAPAAPPAVAPNAPGAPAPAAAAPARAAPMTKTAPFPVVAAGKPVAAPPPVAAPAVMKLPVAKVVPEAPASGAPAKAAPPPIPPPAPAAAAAPERGAPMLSEPPFDLDALFSSVTPPGETDGDPKGRVQLITEPIPAPAKLPSSLLVTPDVDESFPMAAPPNAPPVAAAGAPIGASKKGGRVVALPREEPEEPKPKDDLDFPPLPLVGGTRRAPLPKLTPLPPRTPARAPDHGTSDPPLPIVGSRLAAPAAPKAMEVPPIKTPHLRGTDAELAKAGAPVTSTKDLFDDQDPELELDWGKNPPPTKRG